MQLGLPDNMVDGVYVQAFWETDTQRSHIPFYDIASEAKWYHLCNTVFIEEIKILFQVQKERKRNVLHLIMGVWQSSKRVHRIKTPAKAILKKKCNMSYSSIFYRIFNYICSIQSQNKGEKKPTEGMFVGKSLARTFKFNPCLAGCP